MFRRPVYSEHAFLERPNIAVVGFLGPDFGGFSEQADGKKCGQISTSVTNGRPLYVLGRVHPISSDFH